METPSQNSTMRSNRNEAAELHGNRTPQTEEERRRHMAEVRVRENEKRQQVEERKRAILAAEKARRENILRKSLERDNKFELKRRESFSAGFAFGSSTPRLVGGTADAGNATNTPSSHCARRRSASMSHGDSTNSSQRNKPKELGTSTATTTTTKKRTVSTCGSVSDKVTPEKSSSNAAHSLNFQMTTPKRKTNLMSTSMIVTSTVSSFSWNTPTTKTTAIRNVKSAATKSEPKSVLPTTNTTKTTPKTCSRIPKAVSNIASAMTKSAIAAYTPTKAAATAAAAALAKSTKTKQQKEKSKENVSGNGSGNGGGNSIMSASFMARNKITTEQEAIAALAERRRLKREEFEREAAKLAQEKLEAELKRQAEVAKENERRLLEESLRLAEEQQRAAAEQLRKAFEEAKIREERAQRQRLAREEAESRAKKEADMLKQLEVAAERLRLEEKERKERRKRVEAIMSRMRKVAGSEEKADATENEEQQESPSSPETQLLPLTTDFNTHAKYNVNSTGIVIVRESNFNFLRS